MSNEKVKQREFKWMNANKNSWCMCVSNAIGFQMKVHKLIFDGKMLLAIFFGKSTVHFYLNKKKMHPSHSELQFTHFYSHKYTKFIRMCLMTCQ